MKNQRCAIFLLLIAMLLMPLAKPAFAQNDIVFTPSGIPISELENEIDMFMEKNIGKSAPGASIAIIKNGEIILSKGYGYSDIENNKLVTEETVFEYGSISKLFVWTSVMQLVEQGKLDLDEDIKEYLPQEFYEKLNLKYSISLRNIMNHSSGFGEYPYDLIEVEKPAENITLAEAILMNHPKQYFKPGTSSSYSNYATALAGYIVENISQEEFYKYQQENIFKPLNMNVAGHIKWEDNPSILDKKAIGYTKISDTEFKDSGWSYVSIYPAGSVIGTAEDLALFAIELMPSNQNQTTIFNKSETISNMLSSSYELGTSGTAHGFFEFNYPDKKAFGHGGNTASFSSQFAFVPEESFGFVVLTNASSEMEITMGLQDLLLGRGEINPSETANLVDAHKIEGKYVSMRRSEGTPSEFVSYLTLATIAALDENNISINMMGLSAEYTQTDGYEFLVSEASHPLFKVLMPTLIFDLDYDENPVAILVGNGFDFSALPQNRTVPSLIANIATLLISFIFLLTGSIAIIVYLLKRKIKPEKITKNIYKHRIGLTFAGTILIANNIFVIMTLLFNPFIKYESLKFMLILNYILTGVASIFIVLGFVNWKKIFEKREKLWFALTVIIVISLISLLVNWNMFTIF